MLGAVVGAIAGFWFGLLSLHAFLPSFLSPAQFVFAVIAGCLLAGALFPKTATLILFPFGVIGGGV